VDNCDTDSRGVELGGVVLTMHHAAAHIDAQDAKIKALVEALEACRDELDAYSLQEYPTDHPVHQRYRKRDYDANPARIALAAAKETT